MRRTNLSGSGKLIQHISYIDNGIIPYIPQTSSEPTFLKAANQWRRCRQSVETRQSEEKRRTAEVIHYSRLLISGRTRVSNPDPFPVPVLEPADFPEAVAQPTETDWIEWMWDSLPEFWKMKKLSGQRTKLNFYERETDEN